MVCIFHHFLVKSCQIFPLNFAWLYHQYRIGLWVGTLKIVGYSLQESHRKLDFISTDLFFVYIGISHVSILYNNKNLEGVKCIVLMLFSSDSYWVSSLSSRCTMKLKLSRSSSKIGWDWWLAELRGKEGRESRGYEVSAVSEKHVFVTYIAYRIAEKNLRCLKINVFSSACSCWRVLPCQAEIPSHSFRLFTYLPKWR
jgi:hypothetical protein